VILGLVIGVLVLAFANGANDNFKGMATLWGTGRYRYSTVLAWATATTFAGSLLGGVLAGGLVRIFNGSLFLGNEVTLDAAFLAAVALGAAMTVLLATLISAPVSTTHALVGSLVGAGLLAAGPQGVKWMAVITVMALPLLFSPLLAMGLTVVSFPLLSRWFRSKNCVCLTEPAPALVSIGAEVAAAPNLFPSFRLAHRSECDRGDELKHWNTGELAHWASAGLISFARGLNDTPKIAALVLSAGFLAPMASYSLVAMAVALGGLLAGTRVARTMSHRVTRIEPVPGMSANFAGALLVGVASPLGLPVSTTHVTMGGIFGVGVQGRKHTDWSLVGRIVLAWMVTLPLAFLAGLGFYQLLQSLN